MFWLLKDEEDFRKKNAEEWERNKHFWLTANLEHVPEVKQLTIQAIQECLNPSSDEPIVVADVGCGDAWLLRELRNSPFRTTITYTGIDYNSFFIERLNSAYMMVNNASFIHADIEKHFPKSLKGECDVVVNAFNFFELPDLRSAFAHSASLIKNNGHLIILTIDPITQLMVVCEDYLKLIEGVQLLKNGAYSVAYKKPIIVDGHKTGRFYYGIAYSIAHFAQEARIQNLHLKSIDQIIGGDTHYPQLYQCLTFHRTANG